MLSKINQSHGHEDRDFVVLYVSHIQSLDATWSLRWGDGRDFRGVRDAGESEAYKRGRLCFQSLVFGIIHAVFALNGVDDCSLKSRGGRPPRTEKTLGRHLWPR